MATTPNLGLPYPAATDAPDGSGQIYALANAFETLPTVKTSGWGTYTSSTFGAVFAGSGNSIVTRWRWLLGDVRVQGRIVFGPGGTINSGGIALGTPTTINSPIFTLGTWQALKLNGQTYPGVVMADTSTTVKLLALNTPAGGPPATVPATSTYPITWASGDRIDFDFTYTPA